MSDEEFYVIGRIVLFLVFCAVMFWFGRKSR